LKPEWWGLPLVQEEKYQEKKKLVTRENMIIIGKEYKLRSFPLSEERTHEARDEFMSPAFFKYLQVYKETSENYKLIYNLVIYFVHNFH
jgi:hypothetical protein